MTFEEYAKPNIYPTYTSSHARRRFKGCWEAAHKEGIAQGYKAGMERACVLIDDTNDYTGEDILKVLRKEIEK